MSAVNIRHIVKHCFEIFCSNTISLTFVSWAPIRTSWFWFNCWLDMWDYLLRLECSFMDAWQKHISVNIAAYNPLHVPNACTKRVNTLRDVPLGLIEFTLPFTTHQGYVSHIDQSFLCHHVISSWLPIFEDWNIILTTCMTYIINVLVMYVMSVSTQ